ncbi:MAG: HAD hydrolase family protein [Roseburia sp.]|nr:HAD hydrolase family protein [Anaeroplasma bactoclasticum]MCM1196624.1 HAD hydrolase family protein [Roseburia sp.]MCM1556653.1 HAD hydrolase family protein [Anaeroplasma bactoclasticum]
MEIYFDLENTLLNKEKTLFPKAKESLIELTKKHKIVILTSASFFESNELLDIPNLQIVSTLENKSYLNGEYQYEPLNCVEIASLLNSSDVYTLYAAEGKTSYIIKYQERMKNFYPGRLIKICNLFPKSIASFILAIYNTGLDSIRNTLKNYHIETLASNAKKTLLLISKTPSTKEEWLKKLKKSPAIGIGDSNTDYEFIKHCEVQVAMKNGDEELKALCNFVTNKTNQENGALDFVITYLKHQQA